MRCPFRANTGSRPLGRLHFTIVMVGGCQVPSTEKPAGVSRPGFDCALIKSLEAAARRYPDGHTSGSNGNIQQFAELVGLRHKGVAL